MEYKEGTTIKKMESEKLWKYIEELEDLTLEESYSKLKKLSLEESDINEILFKHELKNTLKWEPYIVFPNSIK